MEALPLVFLGESEPSTGTLSGTLGTDRLSSGVRPEVSDTIEPEGP